MIQLRYRQWASDCKAILPSIYFLISLFRVICAKKGRESHYYHYIVYALIPFEQTSCFPTYLSMGHLKHVQTEGDAHIFPQQVIQLKDGWGKSTPWAHCLCFSQVPGGHLCLSGKSVLFHGWKLRKTQLRAVDSADHKQIKNKETELDKSWKGKN